MKPTEQTPLTNEQKLEHATQLHRQACKALFQACNSIISPNVNYSLIDKLTDKIGCDTSGDLIDYLEEQEIKAHPK